VAPLTLPGQGATAFQAARGDDDGKGCGFGLAVTGLGLLAGFGLRRRRARGA
jgi:hypothetical protein